MITGTIVGTLLLEIAQPTLAWIFLLLPMEDHTKRSLCSLLLFTSGFKSITRQSYSPALTKSRLGLSIPPLKTAQDWSSNYHDGQGENCLIKWNQTRELYHVILFWIKVVFWMILSSQVASSVFSFFTAFITLFLAFCLTFHVLLPTTQVFVFVFVFLCKYLYFYFA